MARILKCRFKMPAIVSGLLVDLRRMTRRLAVILLRLLRQLVVLNGVHPSLLCTALVSSVPGTL